ncbi:helix-turn-helix domain-containing protein [Micromonospora arborensis]|uniref:DNA-binding response regulator n=1 Tax=Micromonospora arborensis TaxID=2116518 RepID=UPI003723ADFD
MAVPVGVFDPLPMFRRGVVAVLSAAGYDAEDPEDVVAWARQASTGVILLTLGADQDWQLLGQLHGRTQTAVVALFDEVDAVMAARALRAGARSVLPRQVTAAALCRTIEATLDGQAVLPSSAATVLAAGEAAGNPGEAMLSKEQRTWLRRLATGTTVARLAVDAGYSERAMYRLLQALYEQIGVEGRMQAIISAQARGWLR